MRKNSPPTGPLSLLLSLSRNKSHVVSLSLSRALTNSTRVDTVDCFDCFLMHPARTAVAEFYLKVLPYFLPQLCHSRDDLVAIVPCSHVCVCATSPHAPLPLLVLHFLRGCTYATDTRDAQTAQRHKDKSCIFTAAWQVVKSPLPPPWEQAREKERERETENPWGARNCITIPRCSVPGLGFGINGPRLAHGDLFCSLSHLCFCRRFIRGSGEELGANLGMIS